jgi:hypothetical protein
MKLITFGRLRGPDALTRIIWPIGVIMPPPMPWMTRKAISSLLVVASAHSAEPNVNTTSAIRYRRRAL